MIFGLAAALGWGLSESVGGDLRPSDRERPDGGGGAGRRGRRGDPAGPDRAARPLGDPHGRPVAHPERVPGRRRVRHAVQGVSSSGRSPSSPRCWRATPSSRCSCPSCSSARRSAGGRWSGVAVTIAGAVLTSTDPKALRAGTRHQARRVAVGDRVHAPVRRGDLRHGVGGQGGRLPAVAVVRAADDDRPCSCSRRSCVWLRSRSARRGRAIRCSPSMLRLAVLVGVVELVGTIAYARGAEVGLVSIVTAASATYPLIPVFGGVVLLHERPVPTQYVGDRDGDRRADAARGRLSHQPRARRGGRTRPARAASGVVPRIRSAAFSATIITGA